MALYDLEAMLTYINSKTSSKVFVVGHSQVSHSQFPPFFYETSANSAPQLNINHHFSGNNNVLRCFYSTRYC